MGAPRVAGAANRAMYVARTARRQASTQSGGSPAIVKARSNSRTPAALGQIRTLCPKLTSQTEKKSAGMRDTQQQKKERTKVIEAIAIA